MTRPPRHIADLAAFVAETPAAAIPADIRRRGRDILADCVACIIAGSTAPEARALMRRQQARGTGPALVLGSQTRLLPEAAAFLNGVAGSWHDLDEGNLHTKGHAGIQIVPAALAEAEMLDAPGVMLLDALMLAYEASARIYRATRARHAIHPHGTYGPIAAALAIGRLRGLGADPLARIVNLAATLGIATSRGVLADGATVRNVYTGMSGRQGFLAHDLLEAGITGERDAVSSVFGNLYGEAFDAATVTARLGQDWFIGRNYFKRFASGRYVHSALDLVEELVAREGGRLAAAAIERIDVETYFMAATMGAQAADGAFGARFSIPLTVAALLTQGIASVTGLGEIDLANTALAALARRVFVTERPDFTAAYPDRQPTRVTIRLIDGSIIEAEGQFIRGEAENPFPPALLDRKFVDLSRPVLGGAAERALSDLHAIEACPSVRRLTASWAAATAAG